MLLDGGIRRGSDVVKALCLGARAVLIGRAYAYGLAAAGGPGVTRAIDILQGGRRPHDEAARVRVDRGAGSLLRQLRSVVTRVDRLQPQVVDGRQRPEERMRAR